MKTLIFSLLALITFGLLAPQAEAGGYRYRDGDRYYSSRSRVHYGGPSYRSRTSVRYYDDCYRPSYYYRPSRVYYSDGCYSPRYYSRPRVSFSFGF